MNNVYCDKPGHGAYPLRACEKDGKIFVDMDSCTECGPQKMEEEEVYQSFLDRLRILSNQLDSLKWDLDGLKYDSESLKDDVDELIKDYEKENA
ncbi:hypothetical protein CXU03_08710 [Akkermansia muciniphila]|uniref:hypothetical protein n=1 Tax=Akkermansia muciniphila TaxID=239935 RepID=UPI000C9AD72E|nr:hypothetical protein [Akkermansia muciniphila]PNC87330.1 hypothetical protein CXU03_08710 [Akkermansia muciniphila]